MMDWWLVIRTPARTSTWCVGDPGPAELDDLIVRAKALCEFPHGDKWAEDPSGPFHCQLAPGEPHKDVGALACDLAELHAVDPGLAQAWRDADRDQRRRDHVHTVRTLLAQLHDDDKAAIHAELSAIVGETDGHR